MTCIESRTLEYERPALTYNEYSFFDVKFNIGFDSASAREVFSKTYRHMRTSSAEGDFKCSPTFKVVSGGFGDGSPAVVIKNTRLKHLVEIFQRGSNIHRFKIQEPRAEGDTRYEVQDAYLSFKPVMLVDENTCFFLDSERWVAYAESLVFHTILAQIHDHYLLHAGVVSWEGKGVILCGEANRGKTTLTLALVQEGFKFLSDEAAFIDRVSGKVVPFPRSVGLRQKSLTMFSRLDHSVKRQLTKSLSGDDKWLVDVEEVFPGSLGDACEVGVVVFMEGFSQATELVPLSTAEALFRSSKFAHTSAVEPFESMLSVADIFERASCFRLSCGSVAETVAVISEMVRQKWT